MSLPNRHSLDPYDFKCGVEIARSDPPFYALIVAALLKADTQNFILLSGLFPVVAQDAQRMYNGAAIHDEGAV